MENLPPIKSSTQLFKEYEISDLVDINQLQITLAEGDFLHQKCNKCYEKFNEKKYDIWVSFSFPEGEKKYLYQLCESCTKKAVNMLWIGRKIFNDRGKNAKNNSKS